MERLRNVIVIGASNRQDLIDPAVLRAGRLDVKVKVGRPDATAARDIFSKYISTDLPFAQEDIERHGGDRQALVDRLTALTVETMYAASEENKFIEVTYANGEKEVLYFKDFASGALIEGIVSRAKKFAVKRVIAHEGSGLHSDDLIRAIREEFKEHEDLPNTTNPDDWAKVAGKKGEKSFIFGPSAVDRQSIGKLKPSVLATISSDCMQEHTPTNRARVLGTETEFGIVSKDATTLDPVSGSFAVIGHYPGLPAPSAIWDYENENPPGRAGLRSQW